MRHEEASQEAEGEDRGKGQAHAVIRDLDGDAGQRVSGNGKFRVRPLARGRAGHDGIRQ
jgi:hypothetical protein